LAPKPYQIAGALLEEAILHILRSGGYTALTNLGDDPTIIPTAPPVTIKGRGTKHQIDAVADPLFTHSFMNPTRLLIEAKAYSVGNKVGIDIVRNALGTLIDLSEFWAPNIEGRDSGIRYNYRYAIFSTSDFSPRAQEFAFAHDIYLLPLRRSIFFKPVVNSIENIRDRYDSGEIIWDNSISLTEYRQLLRNGISRNINNLPNEFDGLIGAIKTVRYGLIATAVRRFPIFLIPRNPEIIQTLNSTEEVRIYWDDQGWYLRRPRENNDLFSFDIPENLFTLYAKRGRLNEQDALYMKAEGLNTIEAFITLDEVPRIVRFNLDMEWIERLLTRQHR